MVLWYWRFTGATHTRTWQKNIICIWCKILSKIQWHLIKVLSRTYWKFQRALKPNLPLGKRWGNTSSSQNSSLKNGNGVFPFPWCNDNIFLVNHIWNLRHKNCLLWSSSVLVKGIFNWSKFSFGCSVIYIFSHFFSMRSIFNICFSLSLHFNKIGKVKHVFAGETFFNRSIFVKVNIWFQISKCLVYNMWTKWLEIYITSVFQIPF